MMEARMKKISQESKVLNTLFFCTLGCVSKVSRG